MTVAAELHAKPTGELLVQRINLKKTLSNLISEAIADGPFKGEIALERAEIRMALRNSITLIDKELERRDGKRENS